MGVNIMNPFIHMFFSVLLTFGMLRISEMEEITKIRYNNIPTTSITVAPSR